MGLFECQYCRQSTDSLINHSCPQNTKPDQNAVRKFDTGATRNVDTGKFDYEAFFSPVVLKRRAEYMHKHRIQPDGSMRSGDNWQRGIPKDAYMKSLHRHFMDIWLEHRGQATTEGQEEAICAAMFNLEGMLYEILKEK